MKTAPLPEIINPSRLALYGQVIVGSVRISKLNRFKQLLSSEEGQLDCSIHANKDEQQRVMLFGSIGATLKMNCQLCLKPLNITIQQDFELMVVKDDEQAAEVLENHEPVLVQHDRILLKELIEDEAILTLPLAPSHNLEEACQRDKHFSVEAKTENKVETKKPFANLKHLLKKSADGNS